MLRAVFFGGAVCSATAASLCGRMRRTRFEVSGFILLFGLWYHALPPHAVAILAQVADNHPIFGGLGGVQLEVCAVDYLPALLVNSTVTECLYVSDDSAQGMFGDFCVASVVSQTQSLVLWLHASSSPLLRCSCSMLSVSSAATSWVGLARSSWNVALPCWRR